MIKAEEYAKTVTSNKIPAPKYVKLQCQKFLDILNNKDTKYFVNLEMFQRIENTLKLLIMPRGLKAGETIYDCSCGYQWLFYTSVLCVVYKDNPTREDTKLQSLRSEERTSKLLQLQQFLSYFSYWSQSFQNSIPSRLRETLFKQKT
ncbi:MAG: hypothetical protein LBJ32_04035 [Oscillospiraceae bacterium]|nr:hypothetical protein [Oscillospiraceae bacterium]